ncbi:hypothetical protein Csa_005627 [Cucumis sativus]|uniref:Uncharacterized protein n=1 Tax=Cucumis sativus TaxID=3659 RepID=A0A0A0KCP4_CUCSA|nr:hypothetical protein Csa_005627 [Cucumis sativus]
MSENGSRRGCGGGDDKTLHDNVEVTQANQLDAPEEDMTLSVIKETKGDELELVKDDRTLSVIEETQDYDSDVVEDAKTVKGDKTLSVVEETCNDDEQKQGGSVDAISLEELNRKCEEFIRRMKNDIQIEILTI